MDSRSLVPAAAGFQLPVANLRSVFQTHYVERKLAKLPEREHEHLRTTYERMLERGPDRFQQLVEVVVQRAEFVRFLWREFGQLLAVDELRRLGLGDQRVAAAGGFFVGQCAFFGCQPGQEHLRALRVAGALAQT